MKSQVSERLKEPVVQEVLDLIFQPRLDADFLENFAPMTAVNKAHVVMMAEQSILPPSTARALLQALRAIEQAGPHSVPLDPRKEDAYFNYEAAVIARTSADIGGRMHIGRSRNDLQATLQRLHCRTAGLALIDNALDLRAMLLRRAAEFAEVVMPGYTHLQPAQPSTYGFYLLGIADAFARDTARLAAAWAETNRNPLGAAAMTGTSFPIDRNRTAALLGFDGLIEQTQDCVASRDFALDMLHACVSCSITWSRLAQDFWLMVTDEFQTIELPDSVAGTSSIMPQKKNPVIMEHLKGKAGIVLGAYVTAASTMRATIFSNTIDGNREALRPMGGAFREAAGCLRLSRLLVDTARPREARMRALVEQNYSTATDLADAMVREGGLSFRDAHHVAGAVVRMAMDAGKGAASIGMEMVQQAALAVAGRRLDLSEAAVRNALDPARVVRARRTIGGPAPEETRRRVAAGEAALAAERQAQAARKAALEQAELVLEDAVGKWVG